MRDVSGPELRRPAATTPVGVVAPAVGLAALALVAALAAGLSAGTSTPEGAGQPGFSRSSAELVTPTPGMLRGDPAGR